MRVVPASVMFALVSACGSGTLLKDDLKSAGDIADACEEYADQVETETVTVTFPATTDACPWGEGENDDPASGVFTARVEQERSLDVPDDAVICDLDFDFSGLVPGEVQVMVYDDHFLFTFNDIVLAGSYGPGVAAFAEDDGLHLYDWGAIRGWEYHADEDYDPYCVGSDSGDADCDIPDTEIEGPISLSYSEDVVTALSLGAIEDDRYDFGFVTMGDDNAETDCMHETFGFTVEVPYLVAE